MLICSRAARTSGQTDRPPHQVSKNSCVWQQQVVHKSLTCDDLPQFGVQVDGAGQEGADVSSCQEGGPRGQEDLEAADVSVNLQQWLHIFGSGDVLRHPENRDELGRLSLVGGGGRRQFNL